MGIWDSKAQVSFHLWIQTAAWMKAAIIHKEKELKIHI